MSKHNYTQYSNKNSRANESNPNKPNNPNNKPKEAVKPAVTEPVVKNTAPEVNLVQETVNTVTLPETVEGVVVDCAKLNVRAEPDITAEVLCVLDSMSEIEVDMTKSNNEWLHVCTAIGVDGYCMRKYVDVRL